MRRGRRWCGLVTKLRALFPSGGLNMKRLQRQREQISVWIGFNLPSDITRQARRRQCFPSRHKGTSALAVCCTSTWHSVRQLVHIKDRTETWTGRIDRWKRLYTNTTTENQRHSQTLAVCWDLRFCVLSTVILMVLLESVTNGKLRRHHRRNVHRLCVSLTGSVTWMFLRKMWDQIKKNERKSNTQLWLHQRYLLQRTACSAGLLFTLSDLLS